MRKNFTQKLLTIFAFLSVFAGSTAYAQTFEGDALPPQCTGENPGRIAFSNNCATEIQACPGTSVGTIAGQTPGAPGVRFACAPIMNGAVTSGGGTFSAAGTDSGFTTVGGGGTFITYQWFYRTSPTSNFIPVPVSFRTGVAVNGNAANADSTGTGANYAPSIALTSAPGSLDFVRVRYSGTALVPRGCASVSNIITAFDDRTPPTINNRATVSTDTTVLAPGSACTVSVPLRGGANFGPTATQNQTTGLNVTDNFCTTTPANKFTLRYFRDVTFGSTPPNTATSPNQATNVTGPAFNGTEISNPGSFTTGTTTRVTIMVSDSSGNYDTVGYNITISDTTRPVYTGPTSLTRFTEQGLCTANVTASETRASYSDCQTVSNITFQIFDSTATGPQPSIRVLPISGTTTRTATPTTAAGRGSIGDRTFQSGTYYIVFQGTDPSGNQSGTGGPSGTGARASLDTLILRVIDNQNPTITAPRNDTFNLTTGCTLPLSSLNRTAPAVGSDCNNQATNTTTTDLCTNPATSDNCGVASEQVFGPNDMTRPLGDQTNTDANLRNDFFRIGANTLRYVVTDVNGRTSEATQIIFVRDVTRPQVFCQTNETLNTTGESRVTRQGNSCNYRVTGLTNTFSDNCNVKFVRYTFTTVGSNTPYFDTTVRNTATTTTGSFTVNGPFLIGQTIVKSVAFDTTGLATTGIGQGGALNTTPTANNGSDTCSFIVTLVDTENPTILTCSAGNVTLSAGGSGTLVPSQIGTATDCGPGGATLTLSRTAIAGPGTSSLTFGCGDIGTQTVFLIATDAAGNRTVCQQTVTVRSNITVVVSNAVSSFCSNSGAFTVIPTGGTGPYSFDVIAQNPAGTDPANPANGTSGTFSGLNAGTYTVRVTDASGVCRTDTNIVVASSSKVSTDVAITATLAANSSTTLSSTNTTTRLDVRVSEIGGFNATGFNGAAISFFVFKSELPTGVTLSMTSGSVANNDDWTLTETASEYTFTKRATSVGGTGLNCGQNSTVAVQVTRTGTPQSGPFGITFSLNRVAGEDASLSFNNSFTSRLTVRNP
jgi:hypothetical protein